MSSLARRPWVPKPCEDYIQKLAGQAASGTSDVLADRIEALADENRQIHERDCFNLNPATNVMNPRAEALLSKGLGSRPSLGYPGDKYEMGLEAIEQIEVLAAELCAEVFQPNMLNCAYPRAQSRTFMDSWRPANRATL